MLVYDPQKDAYALLGVPDDASQDEIEAGYRRAALIWHPDKSPAPDANERFHEVRVAAQLLRDPGKRREYDYLRRQHLGPKKTWRQKKSEGEPQPFVPLAPPPPWLADKVRVHFDAVLFTLQMPAPVSTLGRTIDGIGIGCLIMAVLTRDLKYAALALIFLFIARVLAIPPHQGMVAWGKVVPGRKVAEYHTLNQRASQYYRRSVPFTNLSVTMVDAGAIWRVEIHGFPHVVAPVLHETRDSGEASRYAQQAARWLQIPVRRAA